jgi:tRNA(Ile)-lysidine synthase
MALLHLAAAAFPSGVEAATVDHGLRPESASEAEFVARQCAVMDIAHATLRPPHPIRGSVQSAARAARYALLHDWRVARGIDWLMTAHHADDQLETLVMRLNRGSGVSGLAGIRARQDGLLRPLLEFRRSELEAYCRQVGLRHVDDPSNGDERFDRVRVRKHLAQTDWLDPLAAVRSATALADSEDALSWVTDRLHGDHVVVSDGAQILKCTDLPRELLRRLLARMVHDCAPDQQQPRGESIDQAIIQLCRGKKVSIGACVATGGTRWTVCLAPPRRT